MHTVSLSQPYFSQHAMGENERDRTMGCLPRLVDGHPASTFSAGFSFASYFHPLPFLVPCVSFRLRNIEEMWHRLVFFGISRLHGRMVGGIEGFLISELTSDGSSVWVRKRWDSRHHFSPLLLCVC